ncbi:PaaX family transcriptional regulator C-terminal domain-containing protein [Streptomyces sp. NPDC101150]|uniref:PaaX family transcriptional regulator n=1 Tax=Streptomyces sp. NPDC101150 TaxID=3366114 RepID=UPI00382800EE
MPHRRSPGVPHCLGSGASGRTKAQRRGRTTIDTPAPGLGPARPRTRRRSDGSPSARALLLTVLGEYVRWPGQDRVWSTAVVAALRACGVEGTAARRAITRLTNEGWLTTEPTGRYTRLVLTPRLVRLLTGWTERLTRAMRETPWNGQWQQLLLRAPAGPERATVEEQLAFEGFGPLGHGVWIAADPGGVGALRALLTELGLAEDATWLVSTVADDPARERALVARAWDLAAVRRLHEDFLSRFADAQPGGDAEAFVLRTRLVHAWRLTFEGDPRLPARLLPPDWPGGEATTLFRHTWETCHEAADRCWAELSRGPR